MMDKTLPMIYWFLDLESSGGLATYVFDIFMTPYQIVFEELYGNISKGELVYFGLMVWLPVPVLIVGFANIISYVYERLRPYILFKII